MAAKRKAPPKRRGYDYGGYVDPNQTYISNNSIGSGISSGFMKGLGLGKTIKDLNKDKKDKPSPDPDNTSGGSSTNAPVPSRTSSPTGDFGNTLSGIGGEGQARGGKIRHTAGPRIGKDDGLIPAQKGEFVIRKSAVKKLGSKVLGQVNKGRLPHSRGR